MYVKDWVILFNMGEICKICKNMADSSQLILLLILEWASNLKYLSHLFRKYSVSKFEKKKKCVVFNLAFDFDHLSAWEWVSNLLLKRLKCHLFSAYFANILCQKSEKGSWGILTQ